MEAVPSGGFRQRHRNQRIRRPQIFSFLIVVRVSRAQIYRVIFILAGAYNIVLGAWAVLAPRALFEVFDLGTPSHPGIWACLGMVIGLYGLIYLQVAFTDPKRRSSAVVIGGAPHRVRRHEVSDRDRTGGQDPWSDRLRSRGA